VLLLRRALARLLQLQFHPATASVAQVCQCLSVYFDVFSAASEANRLQLAAACLPAARQALHISSKKHPAPLLVKYVLQLLQQGSSQQEVAAARAGLGECKHRRVSLLGIAGRALWLGHVFEGLCVCSVLPLNAWSFPEVV
jgi:hypothetical protein